MADRRVAARPYQDRVAAYTQGVVAQIIRDVVLTLVSVLVFVAVVSVSDQASKIQEGRRVGTLFTCSALSAVSLAGQRVIAGSAAGPETPLTRFLEQHGYPPPHERDLQAQKAAQAYQREINRRIIETIGPKAKGLVRRDGTFDCARLARLSIVPK